MTDIPPDRRASFRVAIDGFLQERRDAKLEKLSEDDPKREELIAQFQSSAWIEDAARRVTQIQAVTHSLKPLHPDARGTNLYKHPSTLKAHAVVGSHTLPEDFDGDVVGNAAALDVYKFLRVKVYGKTLLDWMLAGDPDLLAALSSDPAQAQAWVGAFTGLVQARAGVASHTLAKQMFWLVGGNSLNDADYQILAPLYATSLAHEVFKAINEDRFGESAKQARAARREKQDHPTGYAEYVDLALQKMGGTKPQNISQLNSERGGNNYLLSSLPPSWDSAAIREPFNRESVFSLVLLRSDLRDVVSAMRDFLRSDPDPTVETRNRRDVYLDALIDGLVGFAAQLHAALPAGWTRDSRCQLVEAEQLWLDPRRAEENRVDDQDFCNAWHAMNWPEEIGKRFGNWLNAQLDNKLPLGEVEQRYWTRELLGDSEWAWRLDQDRRRVEKAIAEATP